MGKDLVSVWEPEISYDGQWSERFVGYGEVVEEFTTCSIVFVNGQQMIVDNYDLGLCW